MENKKIKKHWTVKEIILLGLVGVFFGTFYFVYGLPYQTFVSLCAPIVSFVKTHSLVLSLDYGQTANIIAGAVTIGPWVMAGPLSALIVRKPGAAIIGETLAGIIEMAIGSAWGITDFLMGIGEGFGSEIGFALVNYKNYKVGLWISTLTCSFVTFLMFFFINAFYKFKLSFNSLLFILFFVSTFIFAGIVVFFIYKILKKSKAVKY